MTQLARLVVALLITIVATWSVAQVAGATTMSLEMTSAAPGDGMDVPGCDDCDADQMNMEDHVLCQVVCAPVVLADLSVSQDLRSMAIVATHVAAPVPVLAGQTIPPDLHPPCALPLI